MFKVHLSNKTKKPYTESLTKNFNIIHHWLKECYKLTKDIEFINSYNKAAIKQHIKN